MSSLINHFYRFGEFILDTAQAIVLREGKPVPLAPKVFDTLLVLVENNGRIVTKEELMNRVWPDSFVEEDNLTYNIKQLRKTFGDDARHPVYIETIARRGYRFIAEVKCVETKEQKDDRFEIIDNSAPLTSSVVPHSVISLSALGQTDTDRRTNSLASLESLLDLFLSRPATG